MVKRTGPTNIHLKGLIDLLRKQASEQKVNIWRRLANDLERPTRNRRIVNISRIDIHAGKDETIVVPGKVLASGTLNKKVNVAAWSFSKQAMESIKQANGSCLSIYELMKKNPKGSKVRILG